MTVVISQPILKKNGIYPVRPEQFKISYDGAVISGKIVNKQYQGREIHYTINCNGNLFTVYSPNDEDYDPEESVNLIYRNIYPNLRACAL
jgi:iron(III) transport system ATP-binding protein